VQSKCCMPARLVEPGTKRSHTTAACFLLSLAHPSHEQHNLSRQWSTWTEEKGVTVLAHCSRNERRSHRSSQIQPTQIVRAPLWSMAAARLDCQRRPSKRATAAARLAPTPSQANARMRAAVVLVPVESSRGGRAGQNARAEGAPRALVLVLLPRGCPTPDSFPGGLKRPGAVDGPPRSARPRRVSAPGTGTPVVGGWQLWPRADGGAAVSCRDPRLADPWPRASTRRVAFVAMAANGMGGEHGRDAQRAKSKGFLC